MNRFRAKKKGKDEDGVPRPSQESEPSMPFLGFRKGKKPQEEEKKPIDLATVLPSDDSFRTSLLMTGLSARFSMLREQDDPTTKIGKASDDSVLFPKRQSRLDLASFRGLGDIAEVESLKVAPYTSDDADSSLAGSIMNRAKPTEGNNLFGGRQKVYKLPANGVPARGDGVMSGRTLYDNDVSQSAFQKWRLAEKERQQLEGGLDGEDELDTHDEQRDSSADLRLSRPESPPLSGYNRNRETSSTVSSIPSVARQSSGATSIVSTQPTPSLKEGPSPNTTSSGPERSVLRTRRLYETGFVSQDTPESGNGGSSRMDISNKQRLFGLRAPENSQPAPSFGSADWLSGERRLLAKASAPNLRSTSSVSTAPTPAAKISPPVPSVEDKIPDSAGVPPSSRPVSETDDNSLLSINPNDRGKATALGVFQKPTQPYDETRYAQRQLQLQKGRETPTQKLGDEVDASAAVTQPRFAPFVPKGPEPSPIAPLFANKQQSAKDGTQLTYRSELSPLNSPLCVPSPQALGGRPSIEEHPAFRESALPTPLSLVVKPLNIPSAADVPSSRPGESKEPSPLDSPTLGPGTDSAGLSVMVRQHLRADSNASSMFDGNPNAGTREPRDWNLDLDVNEPLPDAESLAPNPLKPAEAKISPPSANGEVRDEFADRLADRARRIREKLNSYAETDSRSPSPHGMAEQKGAADTAPLPRPSGLGAILHPRGSKSSLVDRGRDPTSTRAFKMIGISPAGSRTNSPSSDSPRRRPDMGSEVGHEREKTVSQGANEQNPGLRAFQQAKGELQRIKGLDTQARHHPVPQGPPPEIPSPQQRTARQPGGSRASSRTRYHNGVTRPGDIRSNPAGSNSQPPMSPPGLPGTDAKRSQSRPGTSSRKNALNLNLNDGAHASYGHETGQGPLMSPGIPPLVRPGPPTPTMSPPLPPFAQGHGYDNATGSAPNSPAAMRHRANSRGIPTSAGMPPSVPPINPRRRQDSTTMQRDAVPMPPSAPWDRPGYGERRGTVGSNDEHGPNGDMRRPPRPIINVASVLSQQRGASSASKMYAAQGRNPPGHTDLPGGMI